MAALQSKQNWLVKKPQFEFTGAGTLARHLR